MGRVREDENWREKEEEEWEGGEGEKRGGGGRGEGGNFVKRTMVVQMIIKALC